MSTFETPLDAALSYARIGWRVFPLREGTKDGHVGSWSTWATCDEAKIRAHWSDHPEHNVAVVTGRPSGIVVFDIDPKHGGSLALDALEAEHGDLVPSIEAHTGGGGRHLVFEHPGGCVPCSAGKLGLGVDLRGDGGYIVVAPSVHPEGGRYVWEDSSLPGAADPCALPEAYVPLIQRAGGTYAIRNAMYKDGYVPEDCYVSVEALIRRAMPSGHGERNAKLLVLARGARFNLRAPCRTFDDFERRVLAPWWEQAREVVRDQDFGKTRREARHTFVNARLPLEVGNFCRLIFRLAMESGEPRAATRYQDPRKRMLVAMCREAQMIVGDHWGLPFDELHPVLGVAKMTAWHWMHHLENDGIVECLQRGVGAGKGRTRKDWRHSEYRYLPPYEE